MVVVLPAPLGPEQAKALAHGDLEIEPAQGVDIAVVLVHAGTENRGLAHGERTYHEPKPDAMTRRVFRACRAPPPQNRHNDRLEITPAGTMRRGSSSRGHPRRESEKPWCGKQPGPPARLG